MNDGFVKPNKFSCEKKMNFIARILLQLVRWRIRQYKVWKKTHTQKVQLKSHEPNSKGVREITAKKKKNKNI